MPSRTVPRTDAALLDWATAFVAAAAGDPGAIGLNAEQIAALDARRAAFAAARATATNAMTRTSVSVAASRAAADALRAMAGRLVAIVAAAPNVSDVTKLELGVAVRRPSARRVAAPADRPSLGIMGVDGRSVRIRLDAAGENGVSPRRGRARGTIGVIVHSHVGETYPADHAWRCEGVSSAATLTITFGDDVPAGAQVWLRAAWLNPTLESGPSSAPMTTHLAGGGVTLARGLRRAA